MSSGMLPRYTHIINPKLKHTYLSFDAEGGLVIKSPKVSQSYIETLLLKKASWIRRSQERLAKKKGRTSLISSDTELYFLGDAYPLELKKRENKRISLTRTDTHFLMQYATLDPALMQKHLDRFYKKEAEAYIPTLVQRWSKRMALVPSDIRFRKTRRQWGSCSSNNVLSFNTMLMKLPVEAIEYVVVHELAHIEHKHHQKAFWELVKTHLPDYKARQNILAEYTPV